MTTLTGAFGRIHRMGSHCATAVMRDIFAFHGHELSEDLCFGLGSGLGFIYVRHPSLCIFGGRAGGLEKQMAQVLGVRFAAYQSADNEAAWARARWLIDRGIPVVCDVAMINLPYMVARLRVTEDFQFGGHKVILTGFDPQREEAQVYDYVWREPQVVRLDDLKRARGSQIKPDPPENGWFEFTFPNRLADLRVAVNEAIAYNVQQMLYPVAFGLGLRAIERFCKEFPQWPSVMNETRLRREFYIANMSFEKIGTGGGNFRRIYARFLREASRILETTALETEVVPVYVELTTLWKRFSARLERYDPAVFQDPEVRELLREIPARERDGISRLRAIAGR